MTWVRFWDVARKAGVAAACALSAGLAMGLIPDRWVGYSVAALSVAGAYGLTYLTPNVPAQVTGAPLRRDPGEPVPKAPL